jgi:AcrR family transcriptional regulator
MTQANRKTADKKPRSKAHAVTQTYNNIDVGSIRRKQIIAAVRAIIARDGLEAVTIANIATELGTSRGVVVYHYQNKEAILHEVLTSAMNDADASALHFERKTGDSENFADTISEVAKLAKTSSDWWRIYFAFLSQAHVNKFYRDALAWSDKRYRTALAKKLGDEKRAVIVLALMKGLSMQASVTPELQIEPIAQELRVLMERWRPTA